MSCLSVSVAYWRFWLCVSVVYELFLIFILFQVSNFKLMFSNHTSNIGMKSFMLFFVGFSPTVGGAALHFLGCQIIYLMRLLE